MKSIGMFLGLVLLAGCATGPFSGKHDLESSSQQAGTVVNCGGYKTWEDCDRYAKQACPKGYEVINKEENLAISSRSLRVSCK